MAQARPVKKEAEQSLGMAWKRSQMGIAILYERYFCYLYLVEVSVNESKPKNKRVRLKINQENKFALFGIVSAEPDYNYLLLKQKLKIKLRNVMPVITENKSAERISFGGFR